MLRIIKSERGFTLIEVLVALALLGLIASAFLMAISTATKSIYIADERTTSESLARSQLEYVKEQEYRDALSDEVEYEEIMEIPEKYSIWSVDRDGAIVDEIIAVPWDSGVNQAAPDDVGLQKVTIVVKHHDYEVLTLEGYKVDAGVY